MQFPKKITTIAFDADDTLWVNEPFFQDVEKQFNALLAQYVPVAEIATKLYAVEKRNLALYGYGAKGFMLSMIETAIEVTNGLISTEDIQKIITLGKEMITYPIEILPDVPRVLERLAANYTLMVLTKGDLLDQQRKLARSGLRHFFDHVEIVSDKQPQDYQEILARYSLQSEEFVMIGNSLRSDVLPVLELGAYGIHIPFHTTWVHEQVADENVESERFLRLARVSQVMDYFNV